jgi:hypothetical protein
MPLAFANIYADLAEQLRARKQGRQPHPFACHHPTAGDGLRSMAAIAAAVDSAKRRKNRSPGLARRFVIASIRRCCGPSRKGGLNAWRSARL